MKSIFVQTYVGVALLTIAALLATFTIFDGLFEQIEAAEFREILQLEAELVQGKLALAPHDDWKTIVAEHESIFDLDVELKSQPEVVKRWSNFGSQKSPDKLFSKTEEDPWWLLLRLANSNQFLLFQEGEDGPISEIPLIDWFEDFAPIIVTYLILALGVLFLARRISRPMNELSLVASALGRGSLDVRASTHVPAPMDALATSFNRMAENVQRLITDQQILMGAIPHELRTPLSRIRFALDMTRRLDSADALRNQIEVIDGYVDELHATVDEALAITRLSRDEAVQFRPFDLQNLLDEQCESTASTSTKTVWLQPSPPGEVTGHPVLIKRAIGNVVANALKYAASEVKISAHSENGLVTVAVDDDGPGIPEDKRHEVFSPFARLEQSRGRSTGGVGLGLALVDMIMRTHQGTASVGASPLGGARVELRWNSNDLQRIHSR